MAPVLRAVPTYGLLAPPSIKAWHRDYGIGGFIKPDTLPQYFRDRVLIYVGWKDPSPGVPWETAEEVQLGISESDTFCQSELGDQALAKARNVQPPVTEIDMSVAAEPSLGASDDMWNLDGRLRKRSPDSTSPSQAASSKDT